MSVISGCLALVGAAREPVDAQPVILAQLLGEVVVAVDQRGRSEDAVDPRLDLRDRSTALCRGRDHRQGSGEQKQFSHRHGQGLGTAVAARNRRGLRIGAPAAKHRRSMPRDLEVSMQFDPDEGIADLDQHLDTLKRCGRRARLQVRPPRRAQRAPGRDLRKEPARQSRGCC